MKSAISTISGKLLLVTGAAISAILIAYTAVGSWQSSHAVEDQVMELATQNAGLVAEKVAVSITEATASGGALGHAISSYLATGEASRSDLLAMISGVPGSSQALFGAWMALLADGSAEALLPGDAARNADGIFTPWWSKDENGNVTMETFAINTESQWYAKPLATGKGLITEPYIAENGTMITSVSVPVTLDGRIVGVAGVDLELGDLTAMLGSLTSFDGGQNLLVDSSGKWLAAPDAADLTKPYDETGAELVKAALGDGKPRVIRGFADGRTRLVYPFTAPGMNTMWATIVDVPAAVFAAPVQAATMRTVIGGVLILTMALVTMYIATTRIVRHPLRQMLGAVDSLVAGRFNDPVPGKSRNDEIGAIAGAVETLRQGLVDKNAMEEEQRHQQAEQTFVVETLAAGLKELSDGNLDIHMHEPFADGYDQLRQDFNAALVRLSEVIGAISASTRSIAGNVQEITGASNDLSRRTETSAATLEETAAALSELTNSVKFAADGAQQTDSLVGGINGEMQLSSKTVNEAVAAMDAIGNSSNEINKIIEVISDIAFQTNLLALNAGVEAARAGEAGGGFAVVASEVRGLAQRSSDAAREIGQLISQSSGHVKEGIELVGRAGDALQSIISSIGGISEHVSKIASSTHEQATGIVEINSAVGKMDQVQQRNAAMFEETAAACTALNDETQRLEAMVGQFRMPGSSAPSAPARGHSAAA